MTRWAWLWISFTFTCPASAQEPQAGENVSQMERILAPPSTSEVQTVLAGIRHADLSPREVRTHDRFTLSNENLLTIVSHSVQGQRHFGAIVYPKTPVAKKLPVILLACGGDGMSEDLDITQAFSHKSVQFPNYLGGGLDRQFVVVIPSFRGQKLIYNEHAYLSDGSVGDAFDGAATDTLALLNVVLATIEVADQERIAICGGSRGGTVALLAACRDKRIRKSVVIAAPTDMRALFDLYPEQFKLLFFNDLHTGKISEQEARRRFIASSPSYFVDELPSVQLHYDEKDPFVPVEFARQFVQKMKTSQCPVEVHYYTEGIHGFWEAPEFWKAVQEFVSFDERTGDEF